MRLKIYIFILAFIFSSCASIPSQKIIYKDTTLDNVFITKDTEWQGEIKIKGTITVMKGVALIILPGTVVRFELIDKKNNISDDPHDISSGIIIEGKIIAHGTKDQIVTFTSLAQNSMPGDWGKILFKYSKDNIFNYCKFEYAEYAIHAHFSTGVITNCVFSNNMEGLRLGMSKFVIKSNTFENNISRGINFRGSINIIESNNITNNGTGIFLYEKNSKSKIINNNIYDNKNFNIQLGEFYKEDITIPKNWWGSTDIEVIYKLIYDNNDNPELGKVIVEPIADQILSTTP
ncbi:right-handed parallel beta-helix repeat-containing protein [Candidatus Poribacteria bacterium]|nr:right-handed parallel beta-helix repeat-containing protein [Candidatus Poribacteria bacterium]